MYLQELDPCPSNMLKIIEKIRAFAEVWCPDLISNVTP
jgi:hypothetical protein